jgi:toxin-antitoxin system PIN domain toxin
VPGSLFDTNVWIAAIFTTHPFHQKARQALREATPAAPAVFCRSTQQGFLRLASNPALLKTYGAEGMTNRDALVALEALLVLPQVCEREEPPGLVALWHRFAACDTASPKVWMDAYLAAFAMTGGLRLATLDQDFKRFETQGLEVVWIESLTK